MSDDDPRAERQRLLDRLISLQTEAQSSPDPETLAELLQARRALVMFDEARSGGTARPGNAQSRRKSCQQTIDHSLRSASKTCSMAGWRSSACSNITLKRQLPKTNV